MRHPRHPRLAIITLALLALVLAFSGPSLSSPRRAGAAGPHAVTVDGDVLTPGATATVHWSGYAPGPAYIYVCELRPTVPVPDPTSCYGQTLVKGTTAADGTGSAQFTVRSALAPFTVVNQTGVPSKPGGSSTTDCRQLQLLSQLQQVQGHQCGVTVSECPAKLTTDVSAQAGYLIPDAEVGTYNDDPVDNIVWRTIPDDEGGGFEGLIAPRPVPPPDDPPPVPPIIADGPRVMVGGSDLGAAIYDSWGRSVASTANVNFDFTLLDHVRGVDGVIAGSFDVGITGLPLDAAQEQALAAKGQQLVYVPISVSSLALGYNAYPNLPLADLRISPTSLAGLLNARGPTSGNDIRLGSLRNDQGACAPDAGRTVTVYSKGGVNEANVLATSWLTKTVPALWTTGVTNELPPTISSAQLFLNNELVGPGIMSPKFTTNTDLQGYARVGLIDSTWAQSVGTQSAAVLNAANQWVLPSPAGNLATLTTSTIGDDNIVHVDDNGSNPAAYPMVSVMYAVAPVKVTTDFTAAQAAAVRTMLSYFVSPTGQQLAAAKGFTPLPDSLSQRATAAIERIGSVLPTAPTTTTTTTTTTATTPPTTTVGVDVADPGVDGADRSSVPATAASAPPDGTSSADEPTPAVTRRAATPRAASRPASSTAPSTGTTSPTQSTIEESRTSVAATTSSSVPVTTARRASAAGRTTTTTPATLAPDDSKLGSSPAAPPLPTLGVAGASVVLLGQGMRFWRPFRAGRKQA